MNHCPCNFVPGIRKFFDMGDVCALVAPRSLVVACGDEDPIFPFDGVKESFDTVCRVYEHLGIGGKCELVIGHGGHRFYADPTWQAIKKQLKIQQLI